MTDLNALNLPGKVNIVTALSCEARPLIDYYKLKKIGSTSGFNFYSDSDRINLVIAGVGRVASATACGMLFGAQSGQGNSTRGWLNIGAAGHGEHPVGTLITACKVIEEATGKTYYPGLIFDYSCLLDALLTVDQPEQEYPPGVAFDMEASGFFAAASRFSSTELIQVIKVVTDNRETGTIDLKPENVIKLLVSQLESIDSLIAQLVRQVSAYNTIYSLPVEFNDIAEQVTLTSSLKSQLEKSYRRYYALGGKDLSGQLRSSKFRSGRDLISVIDSLSGTR